MTLKEHEKFWAFIALLLVVLLISLPSIIWTLDDARVTLADKITGGLMGVLGVAAGLLFRHSTTEETLVKTNQTLADTAQTAAPQPVQPVEVVNTPENPANVTEAVPGDDAGLPESIR